MSLYFDRYFSSAINKYVRQEHYFYLRMWIYSVNATTYLISWSYYTLSFGWFSGVWILCADVSEHYSIFIGFVDKKMEQCSEMSALKIQTPGITQKKE